MKRQTGTEYYSNRHSCFLLQYHMVFITKYRHPVIQGPIKDRMLELFHFLLEEKNGCVIIEINTDKDHIHVLFEAPPTIQLSVLANNIKTVTSRRLRKEFSEELRPFYWKPYFWSDSYFVCTASEKSKSVVARYIANQGG
jgi:putative transposase